MHSEPRILAPTRDDLLTASNLISLFRLLLTAPVAYLIYTDHTWWAFGLCWFAALTDWLDGYVARATNTVSEWGKVIDPVADKVLVGTIVVMLLVRGLLPLWFVAVVIGRDVLIVLGGVVARRYSTVVLPSMWSGKLAVSAIAWTGVTALVQWTTARDVGVAVSCLLIAVSLWQYARRLHGLIRQTQENLYQRQ
ncbi:MAG: CDP-alcohol phosphatidyltransferase family protein [Candidatus Kapaibacteriota bacterium]|jgi:CDP-diacylglycerol--glycerol-3-phosphate 3-phosphatidyltransferase